MKAWIAGLLQARRRGRPAPPPGAPDPPASFDFDALARDLAGGLSRREALHRLGIGLGGAMLASLGLGPAWAQSSDAAQFCQQVLPPGPGRGQCVTDAAQCKNGDPAACARSLFVQCGPGSTMGRQLCGASTGQPFCCSAGQACCGGSTCYNLSTDAGHCGSCANACGASSPTCCGGTCTNLNTDAENCGGCGSACPAGQTCCGGKCKDLTADVNNCGTCGNACPSGYGCCGGTCTDLSTTSNCGACGSTCPTPPGAPCKVSVCSAGICGSVPAPNGTACDDGNACTRTDTCQNGVCVGSNPVVCTAVDQCHTAGTCDPSTGICSNPVARDGTLCSGADKCNQSYACVSGVCVGSNPVVCTAQDQCHAIGVCDPTTGQCGNPAFPNGTVCTTTVANATATCMGGTCTFTCNTNYTAIGGGCCPTTNVCGSSCCGAGQVCADGICCPTNHPTNCSGACVNTLNDPNNCGQCYRACPATFIGGVLQPPTCCGGFCSAGTPSDPYNCGACGHVCPQGPPNSVPTCNSGVCGWQCAPAMLGSPAYTYCSGACVDTSTDSNNCGSCSNRCGSGLVCCGGNCIDPKTDTTYCGGCFPNLVTNCGNRPCCNGVCADLSSDNNNCGACGHACGTGERCVSGACEPAITCSSLIPCSPTDLGDGGGCVVCVGGYCVNLLCDVNNCGQVGNQCPPSLGAVVSSCTNGQCVQSYLPSGLGACNIGTCTTPDNQCCTVNGGATACTAGACT